MIERIAAFLSIGLAAELAGTGFGVVIFVAVLAILPWMILADLRHIKARSK